MKLNKTSILFTIALLTMGGLMIVQTRTEHPGETIYVSLCQSCHLEAGEGLGALIPPLANSDYLQKNREKLPALLMYGIKDSMQVNGTWYQDSMPGIAEFHPIEISNVLNFIGQNWGNDLEPFTVAEVKRNLELYSAEFEYKINQ